MSIRISQPAFAVKFAGTNKWVNIGIANVHFSAADVIAQTELGTKDLQFWSGGDDNSGILFSPVILELRSGTSYLLYLHSLHDYEWDEYKVTDGDDYEVALEKAKHLIVELNKLWEQPHTHY